MGRVWKFTMGLLYYAAFAAILSFIGVCCLILMIC